MTPVVQQAGEPRVRFECVLSELLARVDDDALVGRVQDAWAALLGSKRASEPTPDDLEWIADNIVAFGDFAKEAELLRNRAALDRALTSRLQAGEPTETVFLRLLNRWDMDAGYQLTDFIRDARALLASRPQQSQAESGSVLDRLNAWRKHPGDGGGNLFRDAAEEIEALQAKIEEIQDVQLGPSDNALLDLIDDLRAGYSDENTSIGPTEQDKAAADMLEQCRAFRLFVYQQVKDGSGPLASRLRDAALAHPNTETQPQAETPLTDEQIASLHLAARMFDKKGFAAILRKELATLPASPAAHPNTGAHPPEAEPIDMVLHCPVCGLQHIDAAETHGLDVNETKADAPAAWKNPPHRSHLCHGCGHIWRPADVPTNGVAAVKTKGKADSASPPEARAAAQRYYRVGPIALTASPLSPEAQEPKT